MTRPHPRRTLALLAAVLVFGATARRHTTSAQQTPPIVRVYGSISTGGGNAPAGTAVAAYAGSTLCGSSSGDGLYDGTRYYVDVDSSIPACMAPGVTLTFQVGGQKANET